MMRKLLNTLYITQEKAYLSLDGENLVCLMEDKEKFRIPFDNLEAVVCFNYLGCSPALMGKCVEKCIPIHFMSPTGRYLAGICGGTKGNVHLRVAQIDKFRENGVDLAKNTVAAKLANTVKLIGRSKHDIPALRENQSIADAVSALKSGVQAVYEAQSMEEILGIEGNCAHRYFSVFGMLFTGKDRQEFCERTKRPPLDPVNATLSFLYTMHTNEYASALETVGLDSYIGFYHSLRSGRRSLACDLVEETRCTVERGVLTMFNLGILRQDDFEYQESGAVFLNDDGRKKVLSWWQEKKREDMTHPYLRQKIQKGILPYVQSNLLAKFVRGDIEEYPCFLMQ